MPDFQPLNALEKLRHRLRGELDVHHATHAIEWGNPREMTEVLKRIQHDLGGDGSDKPADDQLQKALTRFVRDGLVSSFTELKYVCYGSTVPVGRDHWRVIDRQGLFEALLDLVNQHLARPKQFRRCYQGLLSGYFGFERNLINPGGAEQRWVSLRDYLASQLVPLKDASEKRGQIPDWLHTLHEHRNLLSSDPCSRYARGLVQGDQSELRKVCVGLGISNNSWVWEEALVAYVKLVCEFKDQAFKQRMSSVLDLVNGGTMVTLPSSLAIKTTAMLVKRYEKCSEHPEHPGLRDTCVDKIGNPWLKRTAWDAAVNDEPARMMVNSWLKQRLIRDFFELLAADGAADLRRLNYWLKWEPHITDMWFVLGSDALLNKTPKFLELRKRMAGRDRRLKDVNSMNNAFVMRIGQLLVIEFGVTGNACYAFAASDFLTGLDSKILNIRELKQQVHATRLSHTRGWEPRFDFELRRLIQSVPTAKGRLKDSNESPPQSKEKLVAARNEVTNAEPISPQPTARLFRPASIIQDPTPARRPSHEESGPAERQGAVGTRLSISEFEQLTWLLVKNRVEWEDNRPKGGALWVLIPSAHEKPDLESVLLGYGFRFFAGRGYYLGGK